MQHLLTGFISEAQRLTTGLTLTNFPDYWENRQNLLQKQEDATG